MTESPALSATQVRQAVAAGRIIQLGHPIDHDIARASNVPGFELELYDSHTPGHIIHPGQVDGVTGASEFIRMSAHSGTHMDGLSHIAHGGRFCDGTRIDEPGVQGTHSGVRLPGRENFTPIVARGVLYDLPRLHGVERLPRDFVITPAVLAHAVDSSGVDFGAEDVMLFRTGWDTLASTGEPFIRMPIPGPDADVARILAERRVAATGSDTMPYEAAPGAAPLEVHVELIAKAGIFIFEMLDLRELSLSGETEFLFVAAPLRFVGGTGSPINPLAIL